MQQNQPSLVLSDLRLPEGDGFGVLRASKEIDPDVPVIVMTAYGSIEDAVSAMKEGALDFLAKPVDPDHLMLLVSRALEQRRLVTENLLMKEELAIRRGAPQLVGEDPSLRKLVARAAAGGGDRHDRAPRRRERHRQGAVRAFAPRAESTGGRAVCRDQLRGDSGEPARDRAVRLREGGVHGRRRAQARQVRDGAPRHAVPRRDRRAAAGAAGEDSARARGAPVRARRRHGARAGRRPARRRDESCAAAPRSRRGGSARISTSACRSFRSPFRRCASGQETSRCWRATSSSASAAT